MFAQSPWECKINACGDGKAVVGTYCGVGKCNVFGCDCDGGCIKGNAIENLKQIHGGHVFVTQSNSRSKNTYVPEPDN